jgi:hypothetical protein
MPSNRSRKLLILHDAGTYKHRYRIECCFNRRKHFPLRQKVSVNENTTKVVNEARK